MNKLQAKIFSITKSQGVVLVDLMLDEIQLSAMMVSSYNEPQWLKTGETVTVAFKETEVSIGKNMSGQISLRNRIPCNVTHIDQGEIMSLLHLKYTDNIIISAITTRSVNQMNISVGDEVTALIKANEISIFQKH